MQITREDGPRQSGTRQWHAVSIVARGESCAAQVAVLQRRFLSAEVPRLPLPGCARPEACRCVYRHHSDRRATPRRVAERLGAFGIPPVEERRRMPGRRATDA